MRTYADYLTGVFHPEGYHGHRRDRNFFEGWYVKLVSADQQHRWAIIPGVFMGPQAGQADNQAFVQVLDGTNGKAWFHEFDFDLFKADAQRFFVDVADNHFDASGLTLDLPGLRGAISFTSPLDPWPVTPASPGIMGWYGAVPFMECFHGIVSFGHSLSGSLEIDGKLVNFDGGRGYIEKDWGKAFPAGYVWMQSNHFREHADASFIGSVAIIPWMGSAFRGFILGLKHSDRLYKWTTYNRTSEQQLEITDAHVVWRLSGPDGVLQVTADRKSGGLLKAPMRTEMHKRVEETMISAITIEHYDASGKLLFSDVGDSAALEVFGDIDRLLATKKR